MVPYCASLASSQANNNNTICFRLVQVMHIHQQKKPRCDHFNSKVETIATIRSATFFPIQFYMSRPSPPFWVCVHPVGNHYFRNATRKTLSLRRCTDILRTQLWRDTLSSAERKSRCVSA